MAQIRAKAHPDRPPYDEITIVVPGEIVPWKRAQKHRNKDGTFTVFTDPRVDGYLSVVRHEAKIVMDGDPPIPLAFGLELSALAVFPVPKSWSKRRRDLALGGFIAKTSRPDLDNTLKGFKDSVRQIVYQDDAQVVAYGRCAKIYGDRPRLEVRVSIVDHMPPALPATPAFKQVDLFAGTAA